MKYFLHFLYLHEQQQTQTQRLNKPFLSFRSWSLGGRTFDVIERSRKYVDVQNKNFSIQITFKLQIQAYLTLAQYLAELPHPIYARVYRIALRFFSTYLDLSQPR